jgi:hypothetical protein
MKAYIGKYPNYNKRTKKTPARKIRIQLDSWDSWNADHTIALIVLPILKQLKKTDKGAPHTDDEDVPEHLRSTAANSKKNESDVDKNWFKRWNWIMKEMIWAFDQHTKDWVDKFHHGRCDWKFIEQPDGSSRMEKGPKDTHWFDQAGAEAHANRMKNGLRLFAKYFSELWD